MNFMGGMWIDLNADVDSSLWEESGKQTTSDENVKLIYIRMATSSFEKHLLLELVREWISNVSRLVRSLATGAGTGRLKWPQ